MNKTYTQIAEDLDRHIERHVIMTVSRTTVAYRRQFHQLADAVEASVPPPPVPAKRAYFSF